MSSQAITTPGSQSWTWPVGVTSVVAECLGGGGGGGTASGNPATGGGGKGGSYAKATVTKAAEATLTVLVGSGGAIANAGGVTSVTQSGTTVALGAGGAGGATQAASSANGAGGTTQNGTPTGTTLFAGGNGGTGAFAAGQKSGGGGGAAGPTSAGGASAGQTGGAAGSGTWSNGSTYQAAGSAGAADSTNGIAGVIYGAGGSGGKANQNTDRTGGLGAQGLALLTWADPPTTLLRVQTTPKVRAANSATPITMSFAAPPSVGNAVVVFAWGSDSQGGGMNFAFADGMVTDNFGNSYDLAIQKQIGSNLWYACGIFYCPKITATGSPFTIMLNGNLTHTHWFVSAATEVTGLGTGTLMPVATSTGTATGTAVATGISPTVTGEAFVAAVMNNGGLNVASINEEFVAPTWKSEVEELGGSTWMNGEGLSRITTFAGAGVSANWIQAASSAWAAAVCAFQSVTVLPRQMMAVIS